MPTKATPRSSRKPTPPAEADERTRLVHAARAALQALAQTTANAGLAAVLTDLQGEVLDRS